jgi:hypothetical protein
VVGKLCSSRRQQNALASAIRGTGLAECARHPRSGGCNLAACECA